MINKIKSHTKIDLSILKNHFWVYLKMIVILLSSIAISVVFTHLAPKEIYGQYNLIISFLAVFSLFSIPGLNTSVLQSVARGHDGIYKKSVKMSFIWSLVGVPVVFIFGAYYYGINEIVGICLMAAAFFLPFFYAPNTWDGFLQGKQKFHLNAKYSIFQSCLTATAMLTVIFLNPQNLLLIIIAYLASTSISTSLLFIKSLKYINNNSDDEESLKYGYFLTGSIIIGTIANNIDKIVIGVFLNPIELATYCIATTIPLTVKDLFVKTLWSPFAPKMCKGELELNYFIKNRKLLLAFILLIILGTFLYLYFIGDVIVLFFSAKYTNSIYYAQLLVLLLLISIPNSLLGTFCNAKKNKEGIFLGYYIFPVIKIVILLSFIYLWGLIGAVSGLILSMFIQLLLMWVTLPSNKGSINTKV